MMPGFGLTRRWAGYNHKGVIVRDTI